MTNKTIPIFYACDDNFVKYTIVSIHSMIQNASPDYTYRVYILHTGISQAMMQKVLCMSKDNFIISFEDVTKYLNSISDKLPIRDYYSKTTYFRLFIAEMFPWFKKAIYIDSDTVVTGDISKLYFTDIGDAYIGACHDQAVLQTDIFGQYAENALGISRHCYINAGILLINCAAFREKHILDKFIQLLNTYTFVVAQDQDYINIICKDHIHWLDQRWNTEVFGDIPHPIGESNIVHYIMTNKPWHYRNCLHGDIFWSYACQTNVYEEIKAVLEAYTDESRANDTASGENLIALALSEINRRDNYINMINSKLRARDRVEAINKINEYERQGRFDEDIEPDPPAKMLLPEDIDYINKSATQRFKTKLAFAMAKKFVTNLMDDKKFIIKEIVGLENFKNLQSGAVITCNHFHAFDSFAIQLAYNASRHTSRKFYRVIKEGNYTSFPGFYGFLMRNCNTLPLSSNTKTLKKFMDATDTLLQQGNFVLVYPEQSMWWNYRKPKPLKKGAFMFAAKNNVPVLPCFITMRDSDIMGDDGFYVQEYTVHISKPIYPDSNAHRTQNVENMLNENYSVWKEIYEREYQIPLEYLYTQEVQ